MLGIGVLYSLLPVRQYRWVDRVWFVLVDCRGLEPIRKNRRYIIHDTGHHTQEAPLDPQYKETGPDGAENT